MLVCLHRYTWSQALKDNIQLSLILFQLPPEKREIILPVVQKLVHIMLIKAKEAIMISPFQLRQRWHFRKNRNHG